MDGTEPHTFNLRDFHCPKIRVASMEDKEIIREHVNSEYPNLSNKEKEKHIDDMIYYYEHYWFIEIK